MTHNTTARILLAAERAQASGFKYFAASLVQFARMDDPARERCDSSPQKLLLAPRYDAGVDYQAGPKTTEELADFDRRDRNGSGCNG